MCHDFIATFKASLNEVRITFASARIGSDGGSDTMLIQQFEDPEDSDPVAVFALSKIAVVWEKVTTRSFEPRVAAGAFGWFQLPELQMQQHVEG